MALQRLHRDRLNLNVPAREWPGGRAMGRIADLSMGGLSLAGLGSPPPHDIDSIELQLPWTMHGVTAVRLEVEQRWCQVGRGGRWHAGYRILSCPDADHLALNHLYAGFASRMGRHD